MLQIRLIIFCMRCKYMNYLYLWGKHLSIIIMKRILLTIALIALSVWIYGQNRPHFTFAWLSDVHLNSFAYAEDDLRQAIEDINANPDVDFTILSGDVTEFGDTKEFLLLDEILKNFKKPYLLLPGNHDVNWSENGCTAFGKIFGEPHFCYDWQGVRFIGCGAGPSLRMGPPHIPREEILWLDSVYRATPAMQPIVFVNHFPLNQDLSNVEEVMKILRTRNTQAVLAGHLHANQAYDADGIPGAIGRSSLRRKDPIGGYNLVSVRGDTLQFRERIIKTETRAAWHKIVFHPAVREVWKLKDVTDVASQGSIDGDLYVYTNTAGVVHALDANSGKTIWKYRTGNKIFSAPFIGQRQVVVSSCDGCIYALDKATGAVLWKYDTGYPVVACPLVKGGKVYVGSSNGRFHSLRLADGKPDWTCEGLQGYMESRPAADRERVYIGTWGAMFYAIDRWTGKKVWEFDTRRGRYFSPGACWPVVLPYTSAGKERQEQVIVLSSDYFVRAFRPENGEILWASDEAKGRESLGFSPDGKTMYIKGIRNNITAVDISKGTYAPLWNVKMPYESNFIPTRMEATEKYVFIPTEFGIVHAVKADGSGIAWHWKVSHSAVTSLKDAGENRVIVMTMDGTVVCLEML